MIQAILHNVLFAASGAVNCNQGTPCVTDLPVVDASTAQLQQILQITFGILGAAAVFVIVIAGLRFISSQGNPQEVAKARNTVIYAIIGLIIMLAAEGIVSFVLFTASKA